jgi:RNA polymerase sigma factor (sigma-70 family)
MTSGPSGSLAELLRRLAEPAWAAGLSDGELLQRFLDRRDEAAFVALVRRHGPVVLSVCRGILRHRQDSEDAFQATFLVLVRRAGSIRKRQSVGSWLHGVARRVSARARADRIRRAARERQAPGRAAPDLLDEVTDRDGRAALDEEVRRLPEKCRLPFVLCYLEGKTNAEAARLLGCPKGTVLSRLALARRLLRDRLGRRGLGLAAGLAAGAGEATAAVPEALVSATGRAAVLAAQEGRAAGGIPAPVRTLTERVVKAMWLAKLKAVAALVLVTGLVGGSAGLLLVGARGGDRPGSVAAPEGEGPPPGGPADPAPPREADRDRARERDEALGKARAAVEKLELHIQKREQQWADDLVNAQLKVMEAEEALREREREMNLERERERADLKAVEDELRQRRTDFDRQLDLVKEKAPLRAKEEALLRPLENRQNLFDTRWREHERARNEALRDARRAVLLAESQLHLLERQQESQRARAQDLLRAADERVRQLEGGPAPGGGEGGHVADLERKMDQVLRELTELRRELRRRSRDGTR